MSLVYRTGASPMLRPTAPARGRALHRDFESDCYKGQGGLSFERKREKFSDPRALAGRHVKKLSGNSITQHSRRGSPDREGQTRRTLSLLSRLALLPALVQRSVKRVYTQMAPSRSSRRLRPSLAVAVLLSAAASSVAADAILEPRYNVFCSTPLDCVGSIAYLPPNGNYICTARKLCSWSSSCRYRLSVRHALTFRLPRAQPASLVTRRSDRNARANVKVMLTVARAPRPCPTRTTLA